MVPNMEKKRRIKTNRWRWKSTTKNQTDQRIIPVTSHISKAQGICGTLSKMISGKGGYFSMSGTRSWTMTITKAVIQDTTRTYKKAKRAFHLSGLIITGKTLGCWWQYGQDKWRFWKSSSASERSSESSLFKMTLLAELLTFNFANWLSKRRTLITDGLGISWWCLNNRCQSSEVKPWTIFSIKTSDYKKNSWKFNVFFTTLISREKFVKIQRIFLQLWLHEKNLWKFNGFFTNFDFTRKIQLKKICCNYLIDRDPILGHQVQERPKGLYNLHFPEIDALGRWTTMLLRILEQSLFNFFWTLIKVKSFY